MNNIEKDVEKLKCDMEKVMTNHLPHIQSGLERVETNLDWLMKFFWIIASASIGALLASILGLVIK